MVKLIAIYKHPEDVAAFNSHYNDVHLPLALKMPGLVRTELTKITGTPMGTPADDYLMAEMYFEDMSSLQASMSSPEGRAGAKDIMRFAGPLVTMTIGEVVDHA